MVLDLLIGPSAAKVKEKLEDWEFPLARDSPREKSPFQWGGSSVSSASPEKPRENTSKDVIIRALALFIETPSLLGYEWSTRLDER